MQEQLKNCKEFIAEQRIDYYKVLKEQEENIP
jgi:hypothetical protein